MSSYRCFRLACVAFGLCVAVLANTADTFAVDADKSFHAGAAEINISPDRFPVIISGGFLQGRGDQLNDALFARALVLDDGATRLAIVVVDTLMMPRELVDEANKSIERETGIRSDRILVAATHTHTAPSVMGALGTGVDRAYAERLPGWITESVVAAVKHLAPARIGWSVAVDSQHTNCRRWIYRPDRIATDPFGDPSVRAMMHPGYQNPDFIGPAGPEDPGMSVLSIQSAEGQPLAVLANYSMHYFGAAPVSADYFGRFCQRLKQLVSKDGVSPPCVAIMSQGTAGDLHWMDYSQPATSITIDAYSNEVADVAFGAFQRIEYREWVPLAMAERKLTLGRRVPDEKRLAWAQNVVKEMQGRVIAENQREVYALEQIYLHNEPQRELVLQAVRIGDLGITAMPAEVFGITGLKLKARSPLQPTFNMELANGADGYIPPPEQHGLGGYTTWPARTAGLEVEAEPKIVETVLQLLEQVAGQPRRTPPEAGGAYAQAIHQSQPLAYWRLHDLTGPQAADASDSRRAAVYHDGVAFYLDGPAGTGFCEAGQTSRAAHFAGGRLVADVENLGAHYTWEGWFWNGLPNDARPMTGILCSCGSDQPAADQLAIGGTEQATGKLLFTSGIGPVRLMGRSEIVPKTWNHVALVRDGAKVCVYLNGNPQPEIAGEVAPSSELATHQVIVAGGGDGRASFEGKFCEVAFYGRALPAEEIVRHYAAAGMEAPEGVQSAIPKRSDVAAILAAADSDQVPDIASRPLTIVLLADTKDHGPGEHDYPRWQARWALLLGGESASTEKAANLDGADLVDPALAAGAQNVRVLTAQAWPSADQWEKADLVVAFCYMAWNEQRIAEVQKFLKQGGGLVLIHSATWTRPEPSSAIAELTGVGGFVQYRHGPVTLAFNEPSEEHPICRGIPRTIQLEDESYWPPTPPLAGDRVQVLAVSEEASSDAPNGRAAQPMFWTYELGKGRVYGCVLGHNNRTFDHPYFRMALLRGMAWAAHADPRRFDPLVLRSASVRDE
ncbi:MAG: ThuA domain-containing protein [Pirellulaceae bacterium]